MREIVVIGLGPGRHKHLTREAQKYLNSGSPLYFRTGRHQAARFYAGKQRIVTFDHLYEQDEHFERSYRAITRVLLTAPGPGHQLP